LTPNLALVALLLQLARFGLRGRPWPDYRSGYFFNVTQIKSMGFFPTFPDS
jgi:hypothetical protein